MHPLGSTFLVVNDKNVVGSYNDIETAKVVLWSINRGNRLIAEVQSPNGLNRDPHIVGGQNQGAGISAGFNKYWCGWSCINKLMDICASFLENQTGLLTSSFIILSFSIYSDYHIVTNSLIHNFKSDL